MSLSYAPSAKITYSTPQDISDEVLGGTISFCEETGYKQSIMMLTFLWSGFLLSARKQLDEYELVENVLDNYIRSLCKLFPQLNEDADAKEQIEEMLQHYWNNLNRDFAELKEMTEISAFLRIANKLNSENDSASEYLLKKDPNQPFIRFANSIQTSIYHILHCIDTGMEIQYRGIVQHAHYHTHESKPESAVREQPSLARKATVLPSKNKTNFWRKNIVWISIIALLFGLIVYGIADNSSSSNANPDATLTALPEPKSGTILVGQEDFYGSELTITASGKSSYVVKLKNSYGTTKLSFYVRAGETVTVGVPAEYLYVYFASGDTWYGPTHYFGSRTHYSMDDEILDFTQRTWKYTLYPVDNGNFSETPIDPKDF